MRADLPEPNPPNPGCEPSSKAESMPRRLDSLPISVSELNRRARSLIEARFELLWVSGELSNVVRAASGHWYFVLKDDASQVRCVMFRQRAAALAFKPESGMQVDVRALPSLYEARGEFQLGVETMRRAGLGALFEAYERLKTKLAAEGLFTEVRKRPLPPFPRTVGVVTSLQAAALQDVLTTLRRRAPMVDVILYPTAVQGIVAANEIAAAIDIARARREVEVLIVCRGGGGIEDLWAFNAEIVARAIARFQDEARIPVVSGVGHETDFTISDFVADQRAPTPTAAAEMVSPDVAQLGEVVRSMRSNFVRILRRLLDNAGQRVDRAQRSLLSPQDRLNREQDRLSRLATSLRQATAGTMTRAGFAAALLAQRIKAQLPDLALSRSALQQRRTAIALSMQRRVFHARARVESCGIAMQHLAPARVLERGYSIVEHRGDILRDSANVLCGDAITVRLARGRLVAIVTSTENVVPLASDDR